MTYTNIYISHMEMTVACNTINISGMCLTRDIFNFY